MDLSLSISLQPKQRELLSRVEAGSATIVGIGGSRGGAKSTGARYVNLLRRLKYPKTISLMLRRTMPELLNNQITPLFTEFPELRRYLNMGTKILTLPNGSMTEYRTANDQGRLTRLQGASYDDIFVDEATHFVEDDILWLLTCLRRSGKTKISPRLVLTCNPGDVGHTFIKRIFIDHQYYDWENPGDFTFIQSTAWDNVHWAKDSLIADGLSEGDYYVWSDDKRMDYFIRRTEYGRSLSSLPPDLRRANLYGDWNIPAGQYFDCFRKEVHVIPQEAIPQASHQPRWIAMDWGFDDNTAVYWFTVGDDNRVYVYREFVVNNTTAEKIGKTIGQLSGTENIDEFILSRDAFGRKQSERTLAHEVGDAIAPFGIPIPVPADQDRIGGWQLCYQMISNNQIAISDKCPQLIRTLPLLVRDAPTNPNDILGIKGDDVADAFRYGLKTRARLSVKPMDAVGSQITAITPTDQMIQRLAIVDEIMRSSGGYNPGPRYDSGGV